MPWGVVPVQVFFLHWPQSCGTPSISPIGHQSHVIQRCPLTAITKIKVPDRSMSSFLGDTNYYGLKGPGTQAPLSSRGIRRWQPQKSGQTCVKALFWEILKLWSTAEGEHDNGAHRSSSPECSRRLLEVCVKFDACLSGCNMLIRIYHAGLLLLFSLFQ